MRFLEFVIIGLWLAIAVLLWQDFKPNEPYLTSGKKVEVQKIDVVDGNEFKVNVKNSSITAKLDVSTNRRAKERVSNVLKHSKSQRVLFVKKLSDGCWVVDVFFTDSNGEHSLSDWLGINNLVDR